MNKSEFPTKKDYYYSVAIACIILSALIIGLVGNSMTLATKLNFTATVISIILAVIAIIITLVEALKNGHVTQVIIASTNTLEKVTSDLMSSSNEIKNSATTSSQMIEDVNKKIVESSNNLSQISVYLDEEFQKIREMLEYQTHVLSTVEGKMLEGISEYGDTTEVSGLSRIILKNKEYISELMNSMNIVINDVLYYLVYFLEHSKDKISGSSDEDLRNQYFDIVIAFNKFVVNELVKDVPKRELLEGVLLASFLQMQRLNLIIIQFESIDINQFILEIMESEDINRRLVEQYIIDEL